MENKGQVIALDIYENKLKELKRRAKRNGAHNIETRTIDSSKVIKKLIHKADKILIDAPCSGIGVLKRNPDSKWKLQPEFLESIKKNSKRNIGFVLKDGKNQVVKWSMPPVLYYLLKMKNKFKIFWKESLEKNLNL